MHIHRTYFLFAIILLMGNACKTGSQEKEQSGNEIKAATALSDNEGDTEKGNAKRGKQKEQDSTVLKKENDRGGKRAGSYPNTRSMDPGAGGNTVPLPGTSDFRDHFEKEAQRFRVDPSSDTMLRCDEGTVLRFPRRAFTTKKGETVEKAVELRVREYYDRADILMAGLGTKSEGRMLETGGMVHVEAELDGKACELRDGKAMQIEFPRKKEQKDMKLFAGERKGNGGVNWKVESEADLNSTYSGKELDQKPMFPGGDTAQTLYIMEHTEYPGHAQAQGKEGTVRVGMEVARTGELQKLQLLEKAHPSLDRAAFSMVKGMPDWIPAEKDGQRVRSRDTLKVKFQLSDAMKEEKVDEPMSAEKFEKKMEEDGAISDVSTADISNYLFSSSQMGWLNCDRFLDRLRTKEYVVELKDRPEESDVKLFLHEQRSFFNARLEGKAHVFDQIPRNAKISLVVISPASEGYKMAVRETNTRNEDPELHFEQVTMEGLKAEMKRLNEI